MAKIVIVNSKEGTQTPFLRGILTSSLIEAGLSFDLAYQFFAGGDSRGFAYLLIAAEKSLAADAAQDALKYAHSAKTVIPEDASKGLFFNCITGWTCLEINSVKLEAYGLDKYYNAVSPISPEALQHEQKILEYVRSLDK